MSTDKTFVLDTNVLMNDPAAVNKFSDNTVLIPYTVLQELDELKSGGDTRSATARQAIRTLEETIDGGKVINKDGCSFWESNTSKGRILIAGPSIDGQSESNDDRIQNAVGIYKELFDQKTILVTDDISFQLKARADGIPVQKYKNQRVKDVSFYNETSIVYVPKSLIDRLFDDDIDINDILGTDLEQYVQSGEQHNLVLRAHEDSNSNCLVRVSGKSYEITKIRQNYEASDIRARNKEQKFAMDLLFDQSKQLVALAGKAGTGKTLLALASGMTQSCDQQLYDRMTVARPVEPMGREIGFTPGTVEDKLDPWMKPVYDNLERIMPDSKSSGKQLAKAMMEQGQLDIDALTYIRGRSISNQFLIIDEAQNTSPHEIKTIVTRAGEGTKIVITGDPYQIDSTYLDQYNNGLSYVIDRMKDEDIFGYVTLTQGERSNLAEIASECL